MVDTEYLNQSFDAFAPDVDEEEEDITGAGGEEPGSPSGTGDDEDEGLIDGF